ncbi:MAG: DUF4287 domain-containing protein [Acidobacteriota bacterium]|nr:DUF4287 domain-containing protein [Acidobacteriota bacterium]
MPKSPEEMAAAMIANMKEKTGKTLDEWLAITKAAGLAKHGQIVKMLKTEHGMTHGFANLTAHETLKAGASVERPQDPVDAQYSGAKAALRPIYDAIMERVKALGDDVEISPKKAYVSLRRNKQFALIQPSTKTRVDLGINIKGREPEGRLEASGSFNAMVSHRVKLTAADQVDDEVAAWLGEAYQVS